MIDKIKSLSDFVRHLHQVPYLASKNLYKVVSHFLEMDEKKAEKFCELLLQLKTKLEKCKVCCIWKETDKACFYCEAPDRDKSLVCVVETWQDLLALDKAVGFKGLYHVLGGAICPLEGVGPDDLSIGLLIARVKESETIKEVVLAMNQNPEGEATLSFIAQKLKPCDVKITCLARGVPVGSTLEYLDKLTLFKALSERRLY